MLTPGGSYHCDDARAFMEQLPPQERARYRGACTKFGFASLAVVPIHCRQGILGAIHLADQRVGQFPPALVEVVESLAPMIGEAVRRFQAEAELAKHRDHLEELVKQRTRELEAANLQLRNEIAHRKVAEEALLHAAEDLKRSNLDLEQFGYVASHDLQEPLRAVAGFVKLLEHRFPDKLDAKVRDYISGAAEGATRMEQLITDLLAFSRLSTEGRAFAPVNLEKPLHTALHTLQFSIKKANAVMTSDPLPTARVDERQMVQLFQNLLANALKFHSECPLQIHIGARAEQGRWVLSVQDNGIGIDPQYFERIFQVFQRLHTRKTYPGTGIGLAICKKIVERHGGKIWVESQPGQGTTFCFSIPEAAAR
jgi:light-regulated signal transduction histidine kinase (bacteriophytochrome)